MGFLNIDSPFMQALNRIADMMWLNILALLCCLPIITIGPSLTALHYMSLKMVRNEECYITKGFFKAFKTNFKQSLLLWLIIMFAVGIVVGDFFIMRSSQIQFHIFIRMVVTAVGALIVFTAVFVFPVQARFENTLFRTLKNAFIMSVLQFPKTILMIILYVLPVALFLLLPQTTPLIFLFGFSLPTFLSAKLYNKFFKKLEDQIIKATEEKKRLEGGDDEAAEDDERIFRDESDELLMTENQH
jgi:uncharacterized membrane protein YesL